MVIDAVWLLLIICSIVFGAANGRLGNVSAAALEGAKAAVELTISLAGTLCLWNGVLEVMRRAGLDRALARAARPLLGRLLPDIREDDEALGAVSANLSANLLGLGNAATPLGIRAASLMARGERATDSLCTFVVMNTASLQLVPATVAALRASLGAKSPFDILPAVWCSSAISLAAGLAADRLLRRAGHRRGADAGRNFRRAGDLDAPSPHRREGGAGAAETAMRAGDAESRRAGNAQMSAVPCPDGGSAAGPVRSAAAPAGGARRNDPEASRRVGAAVSPVSRRRFRRDEDRSATDTRRGGEVPSRRAGEDLP